MRFAIEASTVYKNTGMIKYVLSYYFEFAALIQLNNNIVVRGRNTIKISTLLISGYISVRIQVPIPTVAPSKDAVNRMFPNSCCINITYGGIQILEKRPKNV